MKFARVLFCAAALPLLSMPACTVGDPTLGDDGEPGPDGGVAQQTAVQMFDSQVFPILVGKCQTCHGDPSPLTGLGFMTESPTAYDQLTGWPGMISTQSASDSGLIAFTNGSGHSGPAWDATETDLVFDWIELYLAEN